MSPVPAGQITGSMERTAASQPSPRRVASWANGALNFVKPAVAHVPWTCAAGSAARNTTWSRM